MSGHHDKKVIEIQNIRNGVFNVAVCYLRY